MKEVKTKDGSVTFHSEEFKETYHSISGAKEEAVKKFVEPCKLEFKVRKNKIRVLDFCFGLGYNTAALIDLARQYKNDVELDIIALENDVNILEKILKIKADFESYSFISEAVKFFIGYLNTGELKIKDLVKNKLNVNKNKIIYEKDNIKFTLLLGDAKERVQKLRTKFDIVLFDPFSPKSCPNLWTQDVFSRLYELMSEYSILTTYSCAKKVREAMKKAGFEVKDGPVIGRRAPSTIAEKK